MLPIIFKDIDGEITAYQNFLEYLVSNDSLNFNYLERVTKPNRLFKKGLNLVVVDRDYKDNLHLICQQDLCYIIIKI